MSCPGRLLESKSRYLPLSVSVSLSHLSHVQFLLNTHTLILPVVVLDEIYQQGVQSKSLPKIFSNSPDPLSTKMRWSRKKSCVDVETFQIGHPTHKFPIFNHSELAHNNIICTAVCMIPYLTQTSTHFQPCSHVSFRNNYLNCNRPHLDNQY